MLRGAAAVAVFAAALAGCGGSSRPSAGVSGRSEVVAAPVSTAGNNPFTPKVGTDRKGIRPPTQAASNTGGPASYNASLPGLYGGTRNYTQCDANRLVGFLEHNPSKATAWATTLGIRTTQIRQYVSGLTSVILRTDTRVTNHGYVNGTADPIQSVLQAGTAVFVNQYGQPVVKCYCGNPLTAPVLYSAPVYTGPLWTGFSNSQITIIQQSTTIIKQYILYDPATGMEFPRTPGSNGHDGPYMGAGGGTQPTPQPSQPQGSATAQPAPAQPSAPAENPSVSLSPNPVTQGDTVTLSASGFAPGASLNIRVARPDGVVETDRSTTAGSDGSASYTFSNAAGNAPTGTYVVTVTNAATGASASGSIEVQPAQAPNTTTITQTGVT